LAIQSRRDQSRADGELHQFRARVHVQFIHDTLAMTGDRLWTEAELFSDLLVVPGLSHQFQHFAFALAEDVQPHHRLAVFGRLCLRLFLLRQPLVIIQQPARQRGLQVHLPRGHGADGKTLDFDDGEGVEFVGTLAADNPWEIFNKIAYGQPAAPAMPVGISLGWSWQDITDLLAYLQTLPIE